LGSNVGDRAGNLLLAVRGFVEADFSIRQLSAIFETEPVDVEGPSFLNMVAEVRVRGVRPTQMMARLLRIEYVLGRRDKSQKKPRTIDLDLLFFGDHVMESPFLTLPHPRLHLRKFVLVPLAEIAPRVVHPTLQKEVLELLHESVDDTYVHRWDPNHHHPEPVLVNS
jgi:2-amino-4-hydroxy-6-hydroxymethyldihydropteridine diphosphokinase